MEKSQLKFYGWCLITGCVLMVVTMILHPTGGSFEHIVVIATMAMIAHIIAIASVPFTMVGFWGLHQRLHETASLSLLAFAFALLALLAAVIAAALNGLALPFFVQRYAHADAAFIEQIKPILRYGMSLNHAFDYILMGGVAISMSIWSLCVVRKAAIASWIGWLGLTLTLSLLLAWISGFQLVDLYGFRIFIFGWVFWVISVGLSLIKSNSANH